MYNYFWKKWLFLLLCVMPILQGCTRDKINLWTDFSTVYYPYASSAKPIQIRQGHPFVVNYYTLEGLAFTIDDSPKGKIDRIIAANPLWDFVFYCNCSLSDTSKMGAILRRRDCHFPVVLDTANCFAKMNLDHQYGAIGFVCRPDKTIMGVSIIGANGSGFDKVFKEVKIRLGYPK